MSDDQPATIRLDLLAGVLEQVRGIIGEDSTVSMLHFAALEEGRLLLPEADAVEDLGEALRRLEPLVGSGLHVVLDEPDHIQVRPDAINLSAEGRPVQAIIVGLLEGLLSKTRNRPYDGHVLDANGHGSVIDLRLAIPPGGAAA